jgi:hypothetical protein
MTIYVRVSTYDFVQLAHTKLLSQHPILPAARLRGAVQRHAVF